MAASPRASARRSWRTRSTTATASSSPARCMDYTMPRADNLPSFTVGTTVTRCPSNPLGIKGCGEAGAIAAPAAVMNAITDAIGIEDMAMPATPQAVWAAIRERAPRKPR